MLLHLHDCVARARLIGGRQALRDDTVEPERLEALEPRARIGSRPRRRRDDEACQAIDPHASLLERLLPDRLAVPEQQVERDERRRDLGRQLAHAALRRV